MVSEDDDTSSNEGEFEFFKEPISDTPITPTLKQPLIYDNHLTELEIPLKTEVIQVPADVTLASEDEELSSNEGDYDFTAEPNKEKPFIETLVYNKHLNILETPLVPEAVHVSDVEENYKEDKSGYVPRYDIL